MLLHKVPMQRIAHSCRFQSAVLILGQGKIHGAKLVFKLPRACRIRGELGKQCALDDVKRNLSQISLVPGLEESARRCAWNQRSARQCKLGESNHGRKRRRSEGKASQTTM